MATKKPPYHFVTIKCARAEQPKFEERKGKGYVEYGANNDYPKYLINLYNESPKHGAIVKGKATYIYGKGFEGINQKANTKGESWNVVLKKCIADDEMYGGYYLQIIYNLLGKIKDVYHLEFHKVRTNKDQTEFKVKNDWEDSKEKERTYKAFDGRYDKEFPSRVLFVKQYNPKSDIYPLPNYFQGLNYIESDVQVARHILGNAKDGFSVTKLIQFYNGEPTEEQKGDIKQRVKATSTGSEGDKFWIVWNKSRDGQVTIDDLGNTMLTKEDFTNVNNLIQQEIFACHQITSPMLFGIKTEGQLGGRSELMEAYEIFKNTYVNERQQAHEEVFNQLFSLVGIQGGFKIVPVDPLSFSLKEELLVKLLPREYFLDQLGVDQKYYDLPPVESVPGVNDVSGTVMQNENIKNLTGRQHQNVMRIVRQFVAGKLTKDQAALMLKSGFAFTDDDVNVFLGIDSDPMTEFSAQEAIDFALLEQFGQVGEDKGKFDVLSRKLAKEVEYFSEVQQLSQLESNVINLIRKDKRITAEVIAKALKQDVQVIERVMTSLTESGVLKATQTSKGDDVIIEREVTDINIKGPKATTTEILLRYSYEGPKDDRNRPFCAKLLSLNKLYSRADIEQISERLGYSVWDRRGGWFTQPDGEHRPYCRHNWFALTVIRKS